MLRQEHGPERATGCDDCKTRASIAELALRLFHISTVAAGTTNISAIALPAGIETKLTLEEVLL